ERLTPGGVRLDVDVELARVIEGAISATGEALESLMDHLEGNSSVVDRLEETGVLTRQAAIDLGVTGVAARASGVDRDARRDHRHGAYADMAGAHVQVATGVEGNVHAPLDASRDGGSRVDAANSRSAITGGPGEAR